MSRNLTNLVAAAVIFGGGVLLAQPARADTFACSSDQWDAAEAAANAYCAGASYSIACHGNVVVVTIVACPPTG